MQYSLNRIVSVNDRAESFFVNAASHVLNMHLLLVNPIVLSHLPLRKVLLGEPQRNFLLGRLNSIGAVADITADVLDELASAEQDRIFVWRARTIAKSPRIVPG